MSLPKTCQRQHVDIWRTAVSLYNVAETSLVAATCVVFAAASHP
jgi:hypothetical protein